MLIKDKELSEYYSERMGLDVYFFKDNENGSMISLTAPNSKNLYIIDVFIPKEKRQSGIGKTLVADVVEKCKAQYPLLDYVFTTVDKTDKNYKLNCSIVEKVGFRFWKEDDRGTYFFKVI